MPRASVLSNGVAIYAFRAKQGITQEDLAARSGYSKRTIERLEAGTETTLLGYHAEVNGPGSSASGTSAAPSAKTRPSSFSPTKACG